LRDRHDLPSSGHEHADEPRWFEIGNHRPIVLDIDEAALALR
jgi:hypothetical protein